MLFHETTLQDLSRVPGSHHSFAKHVAGEDGRQLRRALECAASSVPPSVADRWRRSLTSLNNRRFFHAFAEAATTLHLQRAGYRVLAEEWPGPNLHICSADGVECDLLTLGFVRQIRPAADQARIQRLHRALDRVGSRSRIVVLIRRWLPHDFDPEPVRRAIDLWLREVDRGAWTGRYAAFDDDHISLEFALTGETARPEDPIVAFTLGPFEAQHVLSKIESRVLTELERDRLVRPLRRRPLLVAAVGSHEFGVPPGYLREFLLGKPTFQIGTGDASGLEHWYRRPDATGLFGDPQYAHVSGVVFLSRDGQASEKLSGQAWMNPWASTPLSASGLAATHVSAVRQEEDFTVVKAITP